MVQVSGQPPCGDCTAIDGPGHAPNARADGDSREYPYEHAREHAHDV